ncbi:MAG: nucleotidyl transferase AbiEii/AbiGii toxin family protein [Akkermansiaceae bacterium]
MNWEDSKACTPLKRDILRAWFRHESRYFLTGGSALGMFYLHHRRSYDLNLFTPEEVSPKEVQNLVHRVAQEIGAEIEPQRTAPDFHRFLIKRNDEQEILDIVTDRAPQLDPDKKTIDGIRVDTEREMLANKLTTLLSRTEAKDLIDLYFLEQAGHDILAAIPDAREKDGGWEPATVAMLLDSMSFETLPVLLTKELATADLHAFLNRLRLAISELSLPNPDKT